MLSTKNLIIFLFISFIFILSADFSEATIDAQGYDFGNVKLGSTQTTFVTLTNADTKPVKITWVTFSQTSCKDFVIKTSLPKSIPLQPSESVDVKIGYSPTIARKCSGTLWIYTDGSPMWSDKTVFTGIGTVQEAEQPAPEDISQLLLEKLQKIMDYTNKRSTYHAFRSNEQDRLSERRLNTFRAKLMVSYYLIETGQYESAYMKLKEIYEKTVGKPESNDFVSPQEEAHLVELLQELIVNFHFEDKPTKKNI